MAWRIDEYLIRGELDNRIKGLVFGRLWFEGRDEPVELNLQGNTWRDLAGQVIQFTNPKPKAGLPDGLAKLQQGSVGDITASRKVRVPDCSMEEFLAAYKTNKKITFHMANALYLEWYSTCNGRVVIESSDYAISIDGIPAWNMTQAEEVEQRIANEQAIAGFMNQIAEAVDAQVQRIDVEEDIARSSEEIEADEHDARMQKLHDRIEARLRRIEASGDHDAYEQIMEEEREKLLRERGENEPEPLTSEEEAERAAWIEEMNKGAAEVLANPETDREDEKHPLVEACSDLAIRLFHEIKDRQWLYEHDHGEHPMREIETGVSLAGAKLAGALNGTNRRGEWPPDHLFAGDMLVRLKKAREFLRDAMAGLDTVDEQRLATPEWRSQARLEITAILRQVENLIRDVRKSLER